MGKIRVLYDISKLGLAHFSVHRRGGSHRVDQHLVEGLIASRECELVFCANYASLAYEGCVAYLRGHHALGHVPLLCHRGSWMRRGMRNAIAIAHRALKVKRPDRPFPHFIRACGTVVDSRVQRPIVDAAPPADIHHSSTTPLPPLPRGRRVPKRFVTIYDLYAARAPADAAYQRSLLESVRAGDWVLTASEATRRDLGGAGLDESRIRVTPLAADRRVFHPDTTEDPAEIRVRFGIPAGPYLLMLDSRHAHKNITRAVDAFARVIEERQIADLSLVLVGGTDGRGSPPAARVRVPPVRQRILRIGHVTDAALASLYRSATAFVYPSVYEGFGLPALEAMQCGTPVITSNISSLPEVVGGAALLVDPYDVDAIGAAMLTLARDPALRASLRAKGLARAAMFSWERTAACTIAAYRAALEDS
ncbi:MAG: glycosyltransferase family 4 protein [Acidobacteriota bacterium]